MAKTLTLRSELVSFMKKLKAALKKELRQQGHYLTGALENSISYEIRKTGIGYEATMYAVGYSLVIELGVKPERIPYTRRTRGQGTGGTSKYIQGLITYFERRGLPEREAKSAAFATAEVHKREGMPSRSSYAHSRNGNRTGFIQEAFTANIEDLGKVLENRTAIIIEVDFNEELKMKPVKIRV